MKRFLPVFMLFLLPGVVLRAQDIAEVLSDTRTIIVSGPNDAKCHIVKRIQVNREAGEGLAEFEEYTDSYTSISEFSGKVECGGKVVKKLKKSDLSAVNCSEGLADDTFLNYYEPGATYPYVVEYDYTMTYRKGIISFPSFDPAFAFDVPIKEASYSLTVPSGMDIHYKAWTEPERVVGDKTVTYNWHVNDFPAVKREHNMPSVATLVPYVIASPKRFSYLGTAGAQDSWEGIGTWLYGIMPFDYVLPKDLAEKVHQMTDGCADDLEKLRVLYGYLRDHTRYVSIQFGLGGYSPVAPSAVHKSGWGDCKALSFFLYSLLAEAGVKSDYFIVNTDSRDLVDGYQSVGMMNHAMLCVPLQKDTVWVECTNPRVPLGYRHEDVAGHKVVLVDADGGHPVRVPDYPDSLRVRTNIADVTLSPDGSASVRMRRIRVLDEAESYIGFRDVDQRDAVGVLSRYLAVQSDDKKVVSFKDNFDAYEGVPGFIPEACVDWTFNSRKFATITSGRMIVPLALYNSGFNTQKSTRIHDLVFSSAFTENNTTVVSIPEGYEVEFLPEDFSISTPFADYEVKYSFSEGKVTVNEVVTVRKYTLPAAGYQSYKQFVSAYNKASESKLILKRG